MSKRAAFGLTVIALLTASCGQVSSQRTSASGKALASASPDVGASVSPAKPKELLFAVTESHGHTWLPDTVAIVGLDGYARGKATFKPMAVPALACGEAGYMIAPAVAAGGSAFYLSSDGVVRRLSTGSGVSEFTHLPVLTDQEAIWFTVSTEGSKLMATVLAFPPLAASQGCTQHEPGPTRLQLLSATAGTAPTLLRSSQQEGADKSPPLQVLAMVGWDRLGPVATADTGLVGMGSPSGQRWAGTAVHVDAAGNAGARVGGAACDAAYGVVPSGAVVCYDRLHPEVRDGVGALLWKLKPLLESDNLTYADVQLSPDAAHVAFALDDNGFNYTSTVIRGRDGTRIGLAKAFVPQGWLDNQTIIGLAGSIKPPCSGCAPSFVSGNMALVRLSDPNNIVDLGFAGNFVGVVQAAG